jgi:hypothetical protein
MGAVYCDTNAWSGEIGSMGDRLYASLLHGYFDHSTYTCSLAIRDDVRS